MSPRAAWRLEALGFSAVFDYVAGKVDWGAAGLPLQGTIGPRAGDVLTSDVPTCRLDERLGAVRARVTEAGWETCVVTNTEGVVLGQVGRTALRGENDAAVEDVMTEGPSTVRPSVPLNELRERMASHGLSVVIVTTSEGRLAGAVRREAI